MTDLLMTAAPAACTDMTEARTLHSAGTELIPSVAIERILADRDAGLSKYAQALTLLRDARELFLRAANKEWLYGYDRLVSQAVMSAKGPQADRRALCHLVDGKIWDRLMSDTGMYTLMSQKQRDEWDRQLEGENLPEITLDTVLATFRQLSENSDETFAQGLVDVFRQLSWDYKTNNPCRFGKRIVVSRLLDVQRYGTSFSHTGQAKLDDLARVFYLLEKKPVPDFRVAAGAQFDAHFRANGFGGDTVWPGTYFSVRYFKKGTAHITFNRPELVDRLNDIVASRYPGMLPPRV